MQTAANVGVEALVSVEHFALGISSAHTQLMLAVHGQLAKLVLHSLQFASSTPPCGAAEALHL